MEIDLCQWDQVKMRHFGWVLVQYNLSPYQKGKFGQELQRETTT